jgi:hypothetical protein
MAMPDEIEIAQLLSIREAWLDEYWLQDQIVENPACLGLGELETIAKERQQSSGGRLDILLKNPEDDSMYEVEVMLGETDETHIIRTIEYWDNEKRKWPQRQHVAVLVAEHINRRFFNVIHLLSHSIPSLRFKFRFWSPTVCGVCLSQRFWTLMKKLTMERPSSRTEITLGRIGPRKPNGPLKPQTH